MQPPDPTPPRRGDRNPGGVGGGRRRDAEPGRDGGRAARSGEGAGPGGGAAGASGARGRGGAGSRGRTPEREGGSRPGPPGLHVPSAGNEPIGRDRARRRADAPPRGTRDTSAPPRPPLPSDEEPDLPRGVVRQIERTLGAGPRARDVTLALSIGAAAIDEQRPDVAVEVLAWAKHEAPKVAPIREAYGIALYHREQYANALTELQAYRRLTGQVDQNHVIADCFRALGRDLDHIADAAETLVGDEQAPEDRRAEAVIVWAAALADAGNVGAGRAVLRRFLERPRSGDAEHDLRVRYLAADLAEAAGDHEELVRQLGSIVAVDPAFLDAQERLEGARELHR